MARPATRGSNLSATDMHMDDGRAEARFYPEDFEAYAQLRRGKIEGELTPEEETALMDSCRSDFEDLKHATPAVRRKLKDQLDEAASIAATLRREKQATEATPGGVGTPISFPPAGGYQRPYGPKVGIDSGNILLAGKKKGPTACSSSGNKKAIVELNNLIRLTETDPEALGRFLTAVTTPAQFLDEMEKKNPYYKKLNQQMVKDIEKSSPAEMMDLFEEYASRAVPLLNCSSQCFFVVFCSIITRSWDHSDKLKNLSGHTHQYVEQIGRLHRVQIAEFQQLEGQQGFNSELITGRPFELKEGFGFGCFLDAYAAEHASGSFWALLEYLTGDQEQYSATNVATFKNKWGWLTVEERQMNPLLAQKKHPLERKAGELFQDWAMREAEAYRPYQDALRADYQPETSTRDRIANARTAYTLPGLLALFDRRSADANIDWERLTYQQFSRNFKEAERILLLTQRNATQRKFHSTYSSEHPEGKFAATLSRPDNRELNRDARPKDGLTARGPRDVAVVSTAGKGGGGGRLEAETPADLNLGPPALGCTTHRDQRC
jgi:hypothetical protein